MTLPRLTYNQLLITAPKIETDLLWYMSFLFVGLGIVYFIATFFYKNRLSNKSDKVMHRKRELSPMISEFIFYEENSTKEETSNYINLKIEIRQLIKDEFNRKILSEVLLDLRKDVSGETQERLFKLYQNLNLHEEAFLKLKSWRWEVISKAIKDLTTMQVNEAYGFITKFINDKRSTIRKQAEIATVTLKHEGLIYFLDTTKYKISEWQQLKLLDVIRNQKDYQPPRFKAWLTSTNSNVVLFALRLIKYYNQNDANISLIELLKHKNNQIKEEAIRCLKEFQVAEALETLKVVFWKSSTDLKISILDAIGSLGSEKDIEFLQLIENKESNFYVKSKALSSINTIDPERIMPSIGILDTSNYQIPNDLPATVSDTSVDLDSNLSSNPNNVEKDDQLVDKEMVIQEGQLHIIDEVVEDQLDTETLNKVGKTQDEKLHNFQPIDARESLGKKEGNNSTIDTVKNLPIDFEELVFLPIVVDNIEENTTAVIKSDKALNPLHSIEVLFQIVEKSGGHQIDLKIETSKVNNSNKTTFEFNSYDQYNKSEIFNIKVVGEEVFMADSNEPQIHNIEVIEPHFLSFPNSGVEKNLMNEIHHKNPSNPYKQKEMSPEDEEKFKKIIDNLIDSENKEEVNEIIEDLETSSLLEFENESIDISFIPLVSATEDDYEKPENDDSLDEKSVVDQTKMSNTNKNYEIEIPKSILDETLLPYQIEPVDSEESITQLLDDLSEMGDHRELPLLNEMLANQKYATIKERIAQLLVRFSEAEIKKAPQKSEDIVKLKTFNVFEDLFRTCDTQAKLILLNEMHHIADTGDIQFLESLLNDNVEAIQLKAAQVLEKLQIKQEESTEDKIFNSSQKQQEAFTNTDTTLNKLKREVESEATPKEYKCLMEELEINPPLSTDDIFELSFEITADNSTEEIAKNHSHDRTAQNSILGQLCNLSNKIIGKLNG